MLRFKFRVKTSLQQGTTPAVISVSVVPGNAAGQQAAQIRILVGGSSQLLASIPVTLDVSQAPPQLSAVPDVVRFHSLASQPGQLEQSFVLRNTGGNGPVSFSATNYKAESLDWQRAFHGNGSGGQPWCGSCDGEHDGPCDRFV